MNDHRPLADRMPVWAEPWVWTCRLALDADSFVRLLDGEEVPVRLLDPEWIGEYRRRFPHLVTDPEEDA